MKGRPACCAAIPTPAGLHGEPGWARATVARRFPFTVAALGKAGNTQRDWARSGKLPTATAAPLAAATAAAANLSQAQVSWGQQQVANMERGGEVLLSRKGNLKIIPGCCSQGK